MPYKDVDEWLNEAEGFGLRSERVPDSSYSWLKEAWRLGAEAAIAEIAKTREPCGVCGCAVYSLPDDPGPKPNGVLIDTERSTKRRKEWR